MSTAAERMAAAKEAPKKPAPERPKTHSQIFKEAIQSSIDRMLRGRDERQDQAHAMLEPDFAARIFVRAREAAEPLRAKIEGLEAEIKKAEAELAKARKAVWDASAPCIIPAKRRGDVLAGFEFTPARPDPNCRQKTPAAIKIHKERVQPIQRRLAGLRQSLQGCNQDYHELKKIAQMAAAGDRAIIHFMSARWRSVLQVGQGELPMPARLKGEYVDFAGNPLPAAVLDPQTGEPAAAVMRVYSEVRRD